MGDSGQEIPEYPRFFVSYLVYFGDEINIWNKTKFLFTCPFASEPLIFLIGMF